MFDTSFYGALAGGPQIRPSDNFARAMQLRQSQEATRALAEQRQAMADQRRQQIAATEQAQAQATALRGLTEWTPDTVFPILGPEAGAKVLKAIDDFKMGQFDNEEKIRASFSNRLAGIAALPEPMRAEAWDLAVQDYAGRGLVKPEEVGPYSPERLEQFNRELMTPEQRASADKPELRQVGDTLVSVGPGGDVSELYTAQANPQSIEAGIMAALRAGDKAEADRLLAMKRELAAAGRAPQSDPLVAVMGDDGKPVLMRQSQAAGRRPANQREQGRAVTSGDAGRLAELDTSLDDIAVLRETLTDTAGSTGTIAKIGTMLPNVATEMIGWTGPKERQAVIDRVKQVIGKALEGGVLRKEDEIKYEKILPTISDTDAVAKSKLDGLEKALRLRRERQIDALEDAGYDVGRFQARGAGGNADTVLMVTPDGRTISVPAAEVAEAEALGARRK